MAVFHVDSEAVNNASMKVRGSISSVRQELQGMHAHLSELQSSWSGQASQQFQSVMNDWAATQRKVEENLEMINQALTLAGEQYATTEETNARMFS